MKVLHVLANSSPDVNGYAVRTQMLLQYQNELEGMDNLGLTSPWYPDRETMVEEHSSNGIRYRRTLHPSRKKNDKISHKLVRFFTRKPVKLENSSTMNSAGKKIFPLRVFDFFYYGFFKIGRAVRHFFRIGWKVVEEKILIKYFMKRIIQVAQEENVDVIHAHTPYRVGLPAMKAARKLGLPFVYEMRGMWEETAVANGRWMRNGPAYRRFQRYETKVLRQADQVICISETLKKEAISRGVDANKISIVTNAVERKIIEFDNEPPLYQTAVEQLSLNEDSCVVGYIGSLREMEGVDLTAKAVAKLRERGHDVRFFVLTGESGQSELQQLCEILGIESSTVILGPVPHEEVAKFYSLIDIFVVSRPNTRVTQLVTPLKPFEAMAMGRTVVASKLAALEEIIQHEKTGLLYQPDDLEDLTHSIERCIENPSLREQLGTNASEWVLENRTWDVVVKKTREVYQRLNRRE
ncbi:MAG: glycosyltransferase family 4 protein [Candidatus Poseidoniaceae archaeon]|nr:glycosyltransferase family 4 protein [Candidatus Poseidoniaceae archaeon]